MGYVNDKPAFFESQFSLSQSMERLRGCVRKELFRAEQGKPALGVITDQKVCFYWYPTPRVLSPLKPVFIGHFVNRDGKVVLDGVFTVTGIARVQRALLIPGVVVIALSTMFTLPEAFVNLHNNPWKLAGPLLGLTCLGTTVWFLKRIKNRWLVEIDLLTKLMESALSL